MFAKISLMGHTTVIGEVRQSTRFSGLIEVHPFFKDGMSSPFRATTDPAPSSRWTR